MTVLSLLLVVIPSSIIGVVGYNAAKTAYLNGINERLKDQAKDWQLLVDAYDNEITAQEKRVRLSAQNIVAAQAKMTYELINHDFKEGGDALPPEHREDVLARLNRNTVGKTGYIWVLDYKGNYILSKGRQRDGENIWETKDADGNLVIQDLIAKGREVKGSDIAFVSYMWINKGETEPREKIAAMLNFPELGWVVGISTYYDDLVDMGYRERTIEHVKDLMSRQTIGNSGYIWAVDSRGVYQVSKDRQRDGENISESKDSSGNFLIQEAVVKAKDNNSGNDYISYPWINNGETKPRTKVAGLAYNQSWDWVIGVSAYYDDFRVGDLGLVRNSILWVLLFSVIICFIIAFIAANRISSPLRKMAEAGRRVATGDLDAEIPETNSKDEVEDLSLVMSMLVGAIKYLKKEKKNK